MFPTSTRRILAGIGVLIIGLITYWFIAAVEGDLGQIGPWVFGIAILSLVSAGVRAYLASR
jgi:hypothetical protein